jgi:hypothetical protein
MKCQRELSIIGAYGGYSKTPAKHAPVVGNSVLNLLINILGSGSEEIQREEQMAAQRIWNLVPTASRVSVERQTSGEWERSRRGDVSGIAGSPL